jgi:hypothetical protein
MPTPVHPSLEAYSLCMAAVSRSLYPYNTFAM